MQEPCHLLGIGFEGSSQSWPKARPSLAEYAWKGSPMREHHPGSKQRSEVRPSSLRCSLVALQAPLTRSTTLRLQSASHYLGRSG